MIDTENLRTASLYINNQLLSRGLLRDGDSIDFAGAGKGSEGDAVLSGRIISILNDLILRRDRDAESRESLSATMRGLRAENLKLTEDVSRLTTKYAEAQRKADISMAAEDSLKTQLKSAEANAKAQKEEVARMKSLVAQSRSSCATEIRRRDRQIDTLKKQFGEAGRSRGSRGNPAVMTITVTGDIGREKANTALTGSPTAYGSELRSETNATLANLAEHLTEENDTILGMMQRAMAQLQDMSGWVRDDKEDAHVHKRPSCEDMAAEIGSVMDHMRMLLTNPSFVPLEEVVIREEEINRLKTGWVKMEDRWRDAVHLMDGWRRRMAASGKPVCDEELQMGMRLSPVRVNDVEVKGTGISCLSAVKEESEEQAHDFSRSPCPPNKEIFGDAEGENYDDEEEQLDSDVTDYEDNALIEEQAAPNNDQDISDQTDRDQELRKDDSLESIPIPERPQLSPLRNSSSAGNRGFLRNEHTQPRPNGVVTNDEGSNHNQASESKSMRSLPVRPRALAPLSRLPSRISKPAERPRSPSRPSLDDVLLPKRDTTMNSVEKDDDHEATAQQGDKDEETTTHTSKSTANQASSRLTSHTTAFRTTEPTAQQSPLTMSNIAAKLAAAEKEADAARVRAKLRAARGSTRGASRPTIPSTAATIPANPLNGESIITRPEDEETGDPAKQDPAPSEDPVKPEKRKRDRKASKTASRRRSTLSPRELETLISGNAQ
ncbi:Ribosomal RNA-processing protein 7 A [Conoideocrella luteorostrata]|uniref:Ribosomal RNA-processing protein 7 A n=1 Tax=Conoideocrella luteorostrata TaxID=1105319 RepID=A0AAJ0CL82_9HYPO|nr:Ribosomal RNA-processing protein 7 A [Conoideocrella luteorostrata]